MNGPSRQTHTHTTVYATAPCGHRVGVTNEAYADVVRVVCTGSKETTGICAIWAITVAYVQGPPTVLFAPASCEDLARQFHETYERLAPGFGYEIRPSSAVPWSQVPPHRRLLMMATVAEAVDPRA